MDILRIIEEAYDFKEIKWLVPEENFTSNRGNKKVIYWQDEELLNWHITWRDQIGRNQHFLVDRMIRTKTYEPYIRHNHYFITIHDDEITASERTLPDEKIVGQFIGSMLKNGMEMEKDEHINQTLFPETILLKNIDNRKLQDEEGKLLLRALHEGRKRLKLSNNLINDAKETKIPVTDRMEKLEQCNSIFGMFFWSGTNKPPQCAYLGLRNFFRNWKDRYGEASLRKLLSEINVVFPINQEQGNFLLAEIIKPWELVELMEKLNIPSEKNKALQNFKKEWESQRELVSIVADWIELSRKKVVQ